MDSLYLVMPAYNEEENIETVVKAWYPVVEKRSPESRLVIADAGSTDATHTILQGLIDAGFEKLEILSNTGKQHGPKVIALYKYAIVQGANYIFQTDSDGQTNPDEFDAFWDLRSQYDAILGNRTVRGDGQSRAFVEHTVCRLLHHYFGVSVPDANAPFRLMKASLVARYIDRLADDYNLPNIMFTTWFAYYHERLTFKPVSFKPRQGGVNSINIPKIVGIGKKALGDFKAFKKEM